MRHREDKLLVYGDVAGSSRAGLGTQVAWFQSPPRNTLLYFGGGWGVGEVKGAKNGTKSPMCLMCPSQALQSPPAGHLGDTLPHPTYLKTFPPGPCILSPWPPAQVSPEGCRWGAPGGCLPSTRPPAHTWGKTGPVPQPLI